MSIRLTALALALSATSSSLHAQQVATTPVEPIRATTRLAAQGIGYSVVYQDPRLPAGPFQVKVVCTVGQLSAVAHCPTVGHDAHCPTAQIFCR
jgi:hypothetical protein